MMSIKTLLSLVACLGILAITSCKKEQVIEIPSQITEDRIVVKTDNGPYIGVNQNSFEELQAYKADSRSKSAIYNIGRTATNDEIAALDIDIPPDGIGLPDGNGNAVKGATLYQMKCAACHSENGEGKKPFGALVANDSNGKTVGSYWPYATTIFDYVRRSMPFESPGSLTDEEVYSITAFLLYRNKIIEEDMVIDRESLPQIVMPNQTVFVPDDRENYNSVH